MAHKPQLRRYRRLFTSTATAMVTAAARPPFLRSGARLAETKANLQTTTLLQHPDVS